MAEVLKGGQTICMALLKPGWESDYEGTPAVHEVACVGRVVQHQHLPDDRYNIMIHGEMKVAIEGMEREHPYRVARVRPLEEDLAWADGPQIREQLTDLRHTRETTVREHLDLLTVLRSGNPERAAVRMRKHTEGWREQLSRLTESGNQL